MQNTHRSWRRIRSLKVLFSIALLGLLLNVGQSGASAAAEQRTPSSGRMEEERFLQRMISEALDQKETTPKATASPMSGPNLERRHAEAASQRQPSTPDHVQVSYPRATGRIVLGLGAMLAILGTAGYVVRHYVHQPTRFGKRDHPLRVLARVNLTPRSTVALLEAPGKLLVIGVSGSTLTALGEIPVTTLATETATNGNLSDSFAARLDQASAPANGEPPVDDPLLHVSERIQRKVSSLKQL